MNFFVASDGHCTEAIIDGVLFGNGITRLDFSASGETREATVRIDFSVEKIHLSTDEKEIARFLGNAIDQKMLESAIDANREFVREVERFNAALKESKNDQEGSKE